MYYVHKLTLIKLTLIIEIQTDDQNKSLNKYIPRKCSCSVKHFLVKKTVPCCWVGFVVMTDWWTPCCVTCVMITIHTEKSQHRALLDSNQTQHCSHASLHLIGIILYLYDAQQTFIYLQCKPIHIIIRCSYNLLLLSIHSNVKPPVLMSADQRTCCLQVFT